MPAKTCAEQGCNETPPPGEDYCRDHMELPRDIPTSSRIQSVPPDLETEIMKDNERLAELKRQMDLIAQQREEKIKRRRLTSVPVVQPQHPFPHQPYATQFASGQHVYAGVQPPPMHVTPGHHYYPQMLQQQPPPQTRRAHIVHRNDVQQQ